MSVSGKRAPTLPTRKTGESYRTAAAGHNSFNEDHILAITQAICLYRKRQGIDGPLFLGFGTNAFSAPAFATTMEVLAAAGVEVREAQTIVDAVL